MTTWLHRMSTSGTGLRVAVKDAIDVAGVPTTAGCPAIGDDAGAAAADAPVVARVRAGGGEIVGKTNLTELCRPPDGVNPWTGTARNPLDRKLIPGGSSSGSGVVIAADQADLAIATDTGGSSRIPAACCGVAGLKTTTGLLPTDGVFPYAPSMDVVGILARSVAGLTHGLELLQPGFASTKYDGSIGRLRLSDVSVDPVVDQAVDEALAQSPYDVFDVPLDGWLRATVAAGLVITAEGHVAHRHLVDGGRMSDRVRDWITRGKHLDEEMVAGARELGRQFRAKLDTLLSRYSLLALPTLVSVPPRLGTEQTFDFPALTAALNLTGHPALAVPVPLASSPVPASLQLIGPHHAEAQLLAAAEGFPTV